MPSCCIKQCRARKSKHQPNLTLHRFPAKTDLKNKWIEIIGVKNIIPHLKVKYVCSYHFDKSAFNRTLNVIRLHDDAVPTSSHVNHNNEDLISVQGEVQSVAEEEDALYIEPKSEDECDTHELSIVEQVEKLEPKSEGESDTQDEQSIVEEVGRLGEDRNYVLTTQDSDSETDVNMRDVKACRACLDTKGVLLKISVTCKRIFESACGVVISPNDGYPYYFCVECSAQIKKIVAFRRKARRADFVLKEIMTVCNEVSSADISAVDRKVTNLVSSLSVWKPKNIFFYTYDKTTEGEDNLFLKQDVKYMNGVIRTECSSNEDVKCDNEDVKEDFDDQFDDAAAGQAGFDSVDDIIERLGVDDTTSNTEEKEKEIDLNDVFKGLEEEAISEDEEKSIEQIKEEEYSTMTRKERLRKQKEEKRKLKEERDRQKVTNVTCRSIGIKLSNFKITLLHKEEQLKSHEAKFNSEPFKSSLYKCMICIKLFSTVDMLINHCEEHNQMHGKYSCDICKLHLEHDEDMAIHISEKHLYKYSCKLCGVHVYDFILAVQHKCRRKIAIERNQTDNQLNETFHLVPQTQDDMRAALEKTTGAMRCPDCKLAFNEVNTFKKHLHKHEKRSGATYQCDICEIYLTTEKALAEHTSHMHQYVYQCKKCDYVAPNRFRAVEHLEKHQTSAPCPYCPKTSKTIGGMRSHIKKSHYKETYNKICPLCGLCFRSYMMFYTHQLERHKYLYIPHPPQAGSEFACLQCKIEFKSKRAYEMHLLLYEHEAAKDIPFVCRPCKKIFDNEESRDMHVLRCRSNKAFPIKCSICNVEVKSGIDYYYHCKKAHPGCLVQRKGKLCEQCGKIFPPRKFSGHLCQQKENFLYACTICDKQFLTSRSYVIHMIYKHTEKPFHCAICPEKFKRRNNLKEHILKVHTPVMPYTCSVCHREFAVLKYLHEHATTFHGVDLKEEYKNKNRKCHMFIYPHMKLDVSSIDKNKIGELTFDIRDYNDTIIDTINNEESYEKYFIFDPKLEKPESIVEIKQTTHKRRSKGEVPVKSKKKKPQTLVVESGENLDIIEVDGKKYVTIDGVVYHVENM